MSVSTGFAPVPAFRDRYRGHADEAAAKVKDIMTKNGFYQGKDPMNFAATAPGMWVGKGKPLPF